MKNDKAVALNYQHGDYAPRILARASGETAEILRRIASASGVPVVQAPQLADSLTKLNPFDYVPEEYWQIVAEILKFVYETRGDDELH